MTIRQAIKYWLYSSCPGFAGSFPYFGIRVYFPQGSMLFRLTCLQGTSELGNLRVLQGLVFPGSYFFDVGTNIGLMSVPLLSTVPDVRIVSFEPSPNTLPCLQRTIKQYSQDSRSDRWNLIPKAVGREIGQVTFSLSKPENGPFDGIKSTQRVEEAGQVKVEITTLDHEWEQLGSPNVSVIKVDVEGAELAVLQGARSLIESNRPFVLLEWNKVNLKPYGVAPGALYDFALAQRYTVFALPLCIPVASAEELELYASRTESFLLSPDEVPRYKLWSQLLR
jgi:FkbM family methyltransferase